MENLEKFRNLVGAHDVYYMYSDDGRVFSKYDANYRAIREIYNSADENKDELRAIWNEHIDLTVTLKERTFYYW